MSLVIALALITTPASDDKPDAATCAAIRELSVSLQILDERETRYMLSRDEEIRFDLNLLRSRYETLKDAPLVEEAEIFPPREWLNESLSFNRAYRGHVEGQLQLDLVHQWELSQILRRCDELYCTLDMVRDSRCDYYYVTVKRMALSKLVEKYGSLYLVPMNYIPLEYFQEAP